MSLTDTIIDVVPILDQQSRIVQEGIRFRNRTLHEWEEEVSLPHVHAKMSLTELQEFNFRFVNVNETVMNNLSFAKSYFEIATTQYEMANKTRQNAILADVDNDKKRAPGADTLEKMASLSCTKEYSAMRIAELFYEFWKVQYDKLRLLDSRLTSINYMSRLHTNA